ncbi:MAG: hypothetical protein J4432_02110 [DPANN group archaeon]|nr:hypothetical protein [DPANN group archaeon]
MWDTKEGTVEFRNGFRTPTDTAAIAEEINADWRRLSLNPRSKMQTSQYPGLTYSVYLGDRNDYEDGTQDPNARILFEARHVYAGPGHIVNVLKRYDGEDFEKGINQISMTLRGAADRIREGANDSDRAIIGGLKVASAMEHSSANLDKLLRPN